MSVEEGADIPDEFDGRRLVPRKRGSIRSHEQLIGMIILSVAFIIGSFAVASGIRNRNQRPPLHQITVTGSAQQTVTSNMFQWSANISSTQLTTSAALGQMHAWTATIRNALLGAGARNDEISFTTINVQSNTDQYNQVTGFTMSESVNVQSNRLSAMPRVLGVNNLLLARNVPFIASQPRYTFSGLRKLRPNLTKEAAANARLRAQNALGKSVNLGMPISISVGAVSVDQPGNVNFGSGDFNTDSITKVVSVVVSATYSTG